MYFPRVKKPVRRVRRVPASLPADSEVVCSCCALGFRAGESFVAFHIGCYEKDTGIKLGRPKRPKAA